MTTGAGCSVLYRVVIGVSVSFRERVCVDWMELRAFTESHKRSGRV